MLVSGRVKPGKFLAKTNQGSQANSSVGSRAPHGGPVSCRVFGPMGLN